MNLSDYSHLDTNGQPIIQIHDQDNNCIWWDVPHIKDYEIPNNEIWYKRTDSASGRTFAPSDQTKIFGLDLTTVPSRTGNRWVEQDYYTHVPYGNHAYWTFSAPIGGCIGGAFKQNNVSLQWMIFPNCFMRCENETFGSCTNLEYVYFGHDFQYIGGNPFTNCPNLRTVVFNVKTLEQLTVTSTAFNGAGPNIEIYLPNYLYKEALAVRNTKFQGLPVKPFYPDMPECMRPS